ncbi:hypothetical protein F4859DRAFT_485945 [Xylaria cf. heliscus]|nr:hypothetical protein F4859DRAFT_485945 [Xylaria cf. heliscus]
MASNRDDHVRQSPPDLSDRPSSPRTKYLKLDKPTLPPQPFRSYPFAPMLFNPVKFFVFPFVFVVALPLALCAGITTILAFLVLFLRLFLVYFDVGLETLRYILLGHATQGRYITSRGTLALAPGSSADATPLPSPTAAAFRHRRRPKQRGSGGSGSISPVLGFDGLSGVTPSIGLERDFEGVGGWRLEGVNEQQWYNLNSRLENPYRRHHFRSQSGGAVLSGPTGSGILVKSSSGTASHSPERAKLTPSLSRSGSRTPMPQGLTKAGYNEYFTGMLGS